ncbi:MAG: GNAT family N-acetyltransferase [Oscillospiraceae bacterium]|nr:GNAT family N-acetyltransferase [Oscillospiraceae bacterium]
MEYASKEFLLKNGKTCVIRRTEEADAERMIEYVNVTAEETPFLGREPEEASFTLEQEREIIRNMNAAERNILLLAEVDGVHAGNANFSCVKDRARFRHRCGIGVGLYRAFWGMGVGTVLLEELLAAARTAGYEQVELEVVSTNEAAVRLYKKLGFQVTGTLPWAFKYKDGSYADFLLMVKKLV